MLICVVTAKAPDKSTQRALCLVEIDDEVNGSVSGSVAETSAKCQKTQQHSLQAWHQQQLLMVMCSAVHCLYRASQQL
jgi:hypothetical protein